MELILITGAVCAAAFGVQMLLLRLSRTGRKWLRWLLPLPAVLLVVRGWNILRAPTILGGLGNLSGVFYLFLAVCILLGWCAGWAVHALMGRRAPEEEEP